MPDTTNAADCADRAAERVERGWCQGKVIVRDANGRTRCCLLGAIDLETPNNIVMGSEVEDAVRKVVGDDLEQWNDAPGRTKEEVAEALREAARRLRG